MTSDLIHRTEVKVRFGEVDSMQIVWHGNYLKYFEDAREEFGARYGIGYLDVYRHRIKIPIVKIQCEFKKPLKYGDEAIVEARYVNSEAAKIQFDYSVFRKSDMEVVATGNSVQVFLTPEGELLLTAPGFFIDWKRKWGLI